MRRMPSAASIGSRPSGVAIFSVSALLRRVEIELHLAAEEAVGAEPAEHQVGVGDGRLGAAQAVADRAGRGAGAFRPDAQARCRSRRGRCCRRRCRPPGCRSSASAPAGRWHSRRSAPRRSSARCPRRSRRPWRWCRPCRRRWRSSMPMLSHSALAPTTPAAGPDSSMRMQDCRASPTSNSPPVDCTIRKLPPNPASRDALPSRSGSAARAGRHRRWPRRSRCARTRGIPGDSSCER